MNILKLRDPNVGVLAHISQFTALNLGLEFHFHGHKVWHILVGKPFPSICGITILVVVAAAAAD